jgi:predicted nuclease with RNAse H fold
MFLGGLTARAMALKEFLTAQGIRTIEVYPAGLMRTEAKNFATYRQLKRSPSEGAIEKFLTPIAKRHRAPRAPLATSGHELDAYLAFISTLRVLRGEAKAVGLQAEGLVML